MMLVRGEVGTLVVGELKDAVEQLRFAGHNIELWVGRGLISKEFMLRGDPKTIQIISDSIGFEND